MFEITVLFILLGIMRELRLLRRAVGDHVDFWPWKEGKP